MLIPPPKIKKHLDVNYALKILKQHEIVAMKHIFKLLVMTDNGYDEVKSFTHKSIKKTFEIVLKNGRVFVMKELLHLQKEIIKSRALHNQELNFKKSHETNNEKDQPNL